MRLYRIDRRSQPGSCWTGTQDDARRISKEEGMSRAWDTVEVPTDKAGLLAFLNVEGQIATQTAALNDELALPPAAPQPKPAAAPMVDRTRCFEASEIIDFLLDRASNAQVENVLGALGCRFSELAKAVRS